MNTKEWSKLAYSLAMSPEALQAFRHMAGMSSKQTDNASVEAVDELFTLELIERTKNLLNGQEIVVLTSRGKRLSKVIEKRAKKLEARIRRERERSLRQAAGSSNLHKLGINILYSGDESGISFRNERGEK